MPSDLIPYTSPAPSLFERRRERAELREVSRPCKHALVRVEAQYLIATDGLVRYERLAEQAVGVCKRVGPVADEHVWRMVAGFVGGVETEQALLAHRGYSR